MQRNRGVWGEIKPEKGKGDKLSGTGQPGPGSCPEKYSSGQQRPTHTRLRGISSEKEPKRKD